MAELYGMQRTFTCSNYSAASTDPDIKAYLPCPVPIIPEADGFEWNLVDVMTLPENYTCGQKTYADEAPLHIISRIPYGLFFFFISGINLKWIRDGANARGKKLSLENLNQMERMMAFLSLGSFMQGLQTTVCYWYMNADGPPQISLFLSVISAFAIDSVIVLTITGWTGMNNIQGTKAVVPDKYKTMRNIFIVGNLVMQLICASLEPYVSTSGDERVSSDLNINYSYYDGTISSGRHLANLLTEFSYSTICVIEGLKLRNTLKGGAKDDNPAAKKVLKYIKTCVAVMPVILVYRTMIILGRLGNTNVGAFPVCSGMWSLISIVDCMFLLVYGACSLMIVPSKKSKKVKPSGSTATTTASTAG
jgi:hypothetical protein